MEGQIGSTEFDKWVYDASTTAGSYTTTPISLDSSTYAVLYYEGEGEQTWFVQVKDVLYSQAFEAKYETIKAAYTIEKKDDAIKGITPVKLNLSSSSASLV